MRISEWIKKKVLSFLGLEHLSSDPNSTRLTFNNDEDATWHERVNEYAVWYSSNSDEINAYYTGAKMSGRFAMNPIYNRPKREYFWSIVTRPQERVKKTHSGLPRAIVDTLINVIGEPIWIMNDPTTLNAILEANNFMSLMSQEQMAMTAVEGWGAYKINFNKKFSEYPTIQYYEANDCEFIYKDNFLIGIIYKDYYKSADDKDYVLFETRHIANGNSYIEYELFRMSGETITKCELSELPELSELKPVVLNGYKHILGVPSIFFYDSFHKGYGRSIYAGKLDIFDDIDQCLSQASTTVRYSTPIEYINAEFIQRGQEGQEGMADTYCRRYIMLEGEMDSDGKSKTDAVKVTQPELNIKQYAEQIMNLYKQACNGILSISSLGILEEERPNANAQREREKVTIMTRNNIIAKQTHLLADLFNILLDVKAYMDTGKMGNSDYGITVKYNEFATPTFENELQILGSAWTNGSISTDQYVKLLWKDRMSEEEMEQEKELLEMNKDLRFNVAATGGTGGNSGDVVTQSPFKIDAKSGAKHSNFEPRIWVHNTEHSKYIKASEQSKYLSMGYMLGRGRFEHKVIDIHSDK